MQIQSLLVDASNFDQLAPRIIQEVQAAPFSGIDCETQDDNRHPGLMAYCKYDEESRKKAANTKLAFDINRTVMTGFSIYPEGSDSAYYINLNHADVENRVGWDRARTLIEAKPAGAHWITHNANYELTMFRSCYGYRLPETICTMQMAVSAFGPDEYNVNDFINVRQGGIAVLVPDLIRKSIGFTPENPRGMDRGLQELIQKILAKDSDADHSYNGLVKRVAYSYGLKRLIKVFFGVEMSNFADTLGEDAHMGQLTGAQVAAYGAEDAYWAMQLFRYLMTYMAQNCPNSIKTFFEQENPMVERYSDMWFNGMKVNQPAILSRRELERKENAKILREFKALLKTMLPFPTEKHEHLANVDKWYANGYAKYRQKVVDFASLPDEADDFRMCLQVRGPVSNAWATEKGIPESEGMNVTHYMPQRTMLYDLCNAELLISQGKVQSDGEARGKLRDRFATAGNDKAVQLIDFLNKLAGVDQRMKLYLTPYSQLMDPDTGRLYPTVSSMLASRRMASSTPNPMQLAKRGESTYVRGFFEADHEDHVLISTDWSGIELVEIGEFSGDPGFLKAFGQLPHDDLHGGAAASVLSVEVPGLDEEIFTTLKMVKWEHSDDFRKEYGSQLGNMNRLFTDLKGQEISVDKVFKYWRTTVGKGSNFGYWYSGFLGSIGDMMGWDMQTTGKATEAYRNKYSVAEQWRVDLIEEAKRNGVVHLLDGHRRVRFEATQRWYEIFTQKFFLDGRDEITGRYNSMWHYIASEIQKRAARQAVNSVIQGTCATIAKRSVLNIEAKKKATGWTDRELRFVLPIHDELLYSVHKDLVPEAVGLIRGTMIDHPDIFQKCKLDAAPAVGITFEPWHPKKAPFGQIELYEAPELDFIPKDVWGGRMNDDQMRATVDFLFDQKKKNR